MLEAARVSLRCTRHFWLPVHAGCDHMSNCLQKDSQACGYFAFVPTSVSISKSGIGALQRTGVECTSHSGWVWWTHVSGDPLSSSKVRCHECHLSAGWEGGLHLLCVRVILYISAIVCGIWDLTAWSWFKKNTGLLTRVSCSNLPSSTRTWFRGGDLYGSMLVLEG